MLHPIQPANCLNGMMGLVGFQRNVLRLALEVDALNLDETDFRRVLGADAGRWMWKKYTYSQKGSKSEWRKKLDILIAACQRERHSSDMILPAFDNDISFQDHLSDHSFRFRYPYLPEGIRNGITPLFEHFYTYFDGTGYNLDVHGFANLHLTRENFLKYFYGANSELTVCPICDKKPDVNRRNVPMMDLDHFFPKSIYPFLSLHPYNLVPACTDCNSRTKGERDPLKNGWGGKDAIDPFPNTYHPYGNRTIRHLGRISISRVAEIINDYRAVIEDAEGLPCRRVDIADQIYDIPGRWTRRIGGKYGLLEPLIQQLIHQANLRQQYVPGLSQDDLAKDLKREFMEQRKVGNIENDLLRTSYLEYAFNDRGEMAFLLAAYEGNL